MFVSLRVTAVCYGARSRFDNMVAIKSRVSHKNVLASQVTCPSMLAAYEYLLIPEERAHVMAAGSAALRKERLLARVLVRTTLSR